MKKVIFCFQVKGYVTSKQCCIFVIILTWRKYIGNKLKFLKMVLDAANTIQGILFNPFMHNVVKWPNIL